MGIPQLVPPSLHLNFPTPPRATWGVFAGKDNAILPSEPSQTKGHGLHFSLLPCCTLHRPILTSANYMQQISVPTEIMHRFQLCCHLHCLFSVGISLASPTFCALNLLPTKPHANTKCYLAMRSAPLTCSTTHSAQVDGGKWREMQTEALHGGSGHVHTHSLTYRAAAGFCWDSTPCAIESVKPAAAAPGIQ